jgi:hypothetical protein
LLRLTGYLAFDAIELPPPPRLGVGMAICSVQRAF